VTRKSVCIILVDRFKKICRW